MWCSSSEWPAASAAGELGQSLDDGAIGRSARPQTSASCASCATLSTASDLPQFLPQSARHNHQHQQVNVQLSGCQRVPKHAAPVSGGQVVQTDMVACRRGFARRRSQWPNDDCFDDNRDDCGPLNYTPYSPKMHLSCLVVAPACSWQCGGSGFVFIRSASATPFGLRALNRRKWSSSSSSTSTNVSLLTSRPP